MTSQGTTIAKIITQDSSEGEIAILVYKLNGNMTELLVTSRHGGHASAYLDMAEAAKLRAALDVAIGSVRQG